MIWLLTKFGLDMLPRVPAVGLAIKRVSIREARKLAQRAISAVGNIETAYVLSKLLGVNVECDRRSVSMCATDEALVAQYEGPRLPALATDLPAGARFQWVIVRLQEVP